MDFHGLEEQKISVFIRSIGLIRVPKTFVGRRQASDGTKDIPV